MHSELINFSHHAGFSVYALLLMVGGLALIAIAARLVRQHVVWVRALTAVVGIAFFGYGIYLSFFFRSGKYIAVIVPILIVCVVVAAMVTSRKTQDGSAPLTGSADTEDRSTPLPPRDDHPAPRD